MKAWRAAEALYTLAAIGVQQGQPVQDLNGSMEVANLRYVHQARVHQQRRPMNNRTYSQLRYVAYTLHSLSLVSCAA